MIFLSKIVTLALLFVVIASAEPQRSHESTSNESLEMRAAKIVKQKGIDLSKVLIKQVEEELILGEKPSGDITFVIEVVKPFIYLNNTLSKGSELVYQYSDINIISIKDGEIFNVNGVPCKLSISFKKGKFCWCRIAHSYSVNGYTIEPPASVTFDENKFLMFYKSEWKDKEKAYDSGYYGITKGMPNRLSDNMEGFNCSGS